MATPKIRDAQTYRWARRRGHRHLNKLIKESDDPTVISWRTFNQRGPFNVGSPPIRGHLRPVGITPPQRHYALTTKQGRTRDAA